MQAEQQSEREALIDEIGEWIRNNYQDYSTINSLCSALTCTFHHRAALSQPTPQWLPIESAPRDGTAILAFWKTSGGFPTHAGCYGVAMFFEGLWVNPEDTDDNYIEPTHYMPLPAAPLPVQERGDA